MWSGRSAWKQEQHMSWNVFYLARDRESGLIVDTGFSTNFSLYDPSRGIGGDFKSKEEGRRWHAEHSAKESCKDWNLEFIELDGPYRNPFFGGFWSSWPQAKWKDGPPHGISSAEWEERLKSKRELEVFRAGFEAGRKSRQPT
jgi:hypothetical protein